MLIVCSGVSVSLYQWRRQQWPPPAPRSAASFVVPAFFIVSSERAQGLCRDCYGIVKALFRDCSGVVQGFWSVSCWVVRGMERVRSGWEPDI